MCLTKISEPKIATENIFCWKTLYEGKTSTHKLYKYKLGLVQPLVKIEPKKKEYHSYQNIIEEGYHSWINKPYIGKYSLEEIYLCVIPKRTIYYEGLENDSDPGYVSETIVVLGPVQCYFFDQIGTWIRKQKYINKIN
jgi:hypothetical protein